MGEPLHSPYAASKGGMDALTRSLAVELGPEGITVNSVAPGWTRTEMTDADLETEFGAKLISQIPLRRVAEPEDVAYAVCFLASPRARHISGVTLPVEGAYRIRR
jgi:3-oxoacyl-[acyl-carrier protein] reductase